MTCEATFWDGPLQGTTRAFDREEPPLLVYVQQPLLDPHAPLDAPQAYQKVTYVRDVNPFDEGSLWIYMLETADESRRDSTVPEAE